MIADEHVGDDRAGYRNRRADGDVRERPAELRGKDPCVKTGDSLGAALWRSGIDLRVRARDATVEILQQNAVEAAPLRVSKVAGCCPVEAAELGDLVGRERAYAVALDPRKECIEMLPRLRSARDESGLRQRTGVGERAPSNLGIVDRTVEVRTPESIAFRYELAGLGSRFLALIVDQAIQFATLGAIFGGIILAASRLPKHLAANAAEKLGESFAVAFIITVAFAVLFGYFILSEAVWNGQTPGKRLLGLRVVRDGGYPIDFGASLIRNLIRVGEALVGYYILAAISALISPENKRLGDLAAGTIVVRDARLAAPRFLDARDEEPTYASTAYLTGEERALIKRFLERRDTLAPDRRKALAAHLAARLRGRVPTDLAGLEDEPLLERL